MDDQYSGDMIVSLMRSVESVVPSNPPTVPIGENTVFNIPSQAELDCLQALLSASNETPLKTALINFIDLLKSKKRDPVKVAAAFAEVRQLWPSGHGGAKAVGIDLL